MVTIEYWITVKGIMDNGINWLMNQIYPKLQVQNYSVTPNIG
jgi:hypothetical protein